MPSKFCTVHEASSSLADCNENSMTGCVPVLTEPQTETYALAHLWFHVPNAVICTLEIFVAAETKMSLCKHIVIVFVSYMVL